MIAGLALVIATLLICPADAGSDDLRGLQRTAQQTPAPGAGMDVLKGLGRLGSHDMAPPDLDNLPATSAPTPALSPVDQRSVGLLNVTNSVMHFNLGGAAFNLAPQSPKTATLPEGLEKLTLVYSIRGQQRQIVLDAGHSYALAIDAQQGAIVIQSQQ